MTRCSDCDKSLHKGGDCVTSVAPQLDPDSECPAFSAPAAAATHTPGPWMVRPDGESSHVMTQWQNVYDSRRPVCELPEYLGVSDGARAANARLIAAAPDLLAAHQNNDADDALLCDLIAAMGEEGASLTYPELFPELNRIVERMGRRTTAAIAKATGQ